jgi:organic radical activating enzyme
MPTDKKKEVKYKSGIDPFSGSLARMFFPDSELAKQYKKYGTRTEEEINKIIKSSGVSKNVSTSFTGGNPSQKISGAYMNTLAAFNKQRKAATKTTSKSRQRTSSEIAAAKKDVPSKMPTSKISTGYKMEIGSREIESPGSFDVKASSNIAKAPNFANMAEGGASVKEMRSALQDYRKSTRKDIREHKAGIKAQNKVTKFGEKASKIDHRKTKRTR